MSLNTEQRAALLSLLKCGAVKVAHSTALSDVLDSLYVTPAYVSRSSGPTHNTWRLTPLGASAARRIASESLINQARETIRDKIATTFPTWHDNDIDEWIYPACQAGSDAIHHAPLTADNMKRYLAGADAYVQALWLRFDAMRANQERRRSGLTQTAARQYRRSGR